jgi:hypothetical protein
MTNYKKGTLLVNISAFVGQSVGQTVGYGIGIAAVSVRQLPKMNLI